MTENCDEILSMMREYFVHQREIEWLPSERQHQLFRYHEQFVRHLKSCEECSSEWFVLMDQTGQLRRPEDIFSPWNQPTLLADDPDQLLSRADPPPPHGETPCQRSLRWARRYGVQDEFVQIHLRWCTDCKHRLGMQAEESAEQEGSESV